MSRLNQATDSTRNKMMKNLNEIVPSALESRRPILHHLNDDTTWLLQLPIPEGSQHSSRRFFNIILDPWLTGPQSDIASWFSRQWHVEEPALGGLDEVERLCEEVEKIAGARAGSRKENITISEEPAEVRDDGLDQKMSSNEQKEEAEVENELDANSNPKNGVSGQLPSTPHINTSASLSPSPFLSPSSPSPTQSTSRFSLKSLTSKRSNSSSSSSSPSASSKTSNTSITTSDSNNLTPHIDAIVISHEFTDHCHKQTLVQASPTTPIVASIKAVTLINSWKCFDHEKVYETPAFNGNWIESRQSIKTQDIPHWIGISRIVTPSDAFYYHSAVMITFQLDKDRPAESLIYTPHGIHSNSLKQLSTAKPKINNLVLLHGLHDVSIDWGQQLNLGAHNGLAAQRILKARYWIGTHDEIKKGGGVVSWFLRRKVISVQEAIERLGEGELVKETGFVEAGNGESLILK